MRFGDCYLYNTDCVELMRSLPDNSIDMVIADPPYCISKPSNFSTMPDRINERTGTDFGVWDLDFDNTMWVAEASRILKKGGTLIAFNDFKKATIVYDLATLNKLDYKDTIVWRKTNPMPRNRDRRYITNIEMMQLYVKPGGKWVFNRQSLTYESSVIDCAVESGGAFKRYHPTQKPLKLLEHLIKVSSNKGDCILDPFMGGGSTGVACANTGRKFIGCEIDISYYETAKNRILETA